MTQKTTRNRSIGAINRQPAKDQAASVSNKTLRESQGWSLEALESAPFGVIVHDPKGKILIFNAQLEKISGYHKKEIPDIQTWIARLYPDPDYRKLVSEEREKKIPKDRLRIREAIITCKNGEKRICEFSSILSSTGLRTVFIKDTKAMRETHNFLWESKERYRFLSQAAFEGIGIHKGGVLLFANDQFYDMFGYKAQELLGKQIMPICIAHDSLAFVKKQIRSGSSIPYEAMARKKDGTLFPVLVHAKSMQYKDYEVRVAALRDLSYERQAESALRKSEERFRALAGNIREVFWLFDCKKNKIEYVSPAYEQIWGRPVEALYQNYKNWYASIYPDDLDHARGSFAKIAQSSGGGEVCEYRILRPDGTVRWISDRGFAVTDEKGDVVRLAGISDDITERRQALEALRESEEKFRTVAEQSPNMIFINSQGRVVYANRKCEQIMGYSRDEFYAPDFDFMTLIAPEHREMIQSNFRRYMRGEEVEPYEYALVKRDGKRIDVIITSKLINYDGEQSLLGIITDISERKRTEKALQIKDVKLERQAKNLEEVNTALKVLLEQREKEKTEMKEALLANIKRLVFPYIKKLEDTGLDEDAQTFVNIIKSNINDLISPFASKLSSKYFALTPTEIQVADLIKQGKTSKEIASMLNVSPKAVSFHRGNLRKKLGLVNKKINLRTYLHSFPH
jgi:PAS domain S-box-containing protein